MSQTIDNRALTTTRVARPRRYLMCNPAYFEVVYSINPWMDPAKPTSTDRGLSQWKRLYDVFTDLGHSVELIEPLPGLPDMVFAANGAIVADGKALVAWFRHQEREGESEPHLEWFRDHGWSDVRQAVNTNEGEGDFLCVGKEILAGRGFRSTPESHTEVADYFGRQVMSLTLVDPRFYHLDTALSVLDDGEIMYFPPAFDPGSRELLADRFPDAILAEESDAVVFGLNAVSDGLHIVLPIQATRLAAQLRERGYEPIGVDLSELLSAGGSVKCCTLELRP